MAVILFYITGGDWMLDSFVRGAQVAGHDCFVSFYTYGWSRTKFDGKAVDFVNSDLLKLEDKVRSISSVKKIDLLFFCTSDDNLQEANLKRISALNIPMVLYHPDMGFLWFRILRFAKYFRLIACAQQMHMEYLQKLGYPVCFLPFGGIPTVSESYLPDFKGVRYLGSPFGNRAAVLGRLQTKGIPLEVYGHNWDWFQRQQPVDQFAVKKSGFRLPWLGPKARIDIRYYLCPKLRFEPLLLGHKVLETLKHSLFPSRHLDVEAFYGHIPPGCIKGKYHRDDFERLVQSAVINIGFSHMYAYGHPAAQMRQMRLRDIEVPMAGGFYLAEYCTDIAACFEDGKHLVMWHTEEDLYEKAHYYLNHPEKAVEIAKAGQEHAIQNHTWDHRFNLLFKLLGIQSGSN